MRDLNAKNTEKENSKDINRNQWNRRRMYNSENEQVKRLFIEKLNKIDKRLIWLFKKRENINININREKETFLQI